MILDMNSKIVISYATDYCTPTITKKLINESDYLQSEFRELVSVTTKNINFKLEFNENIQNQNEIDARFKNTTIFTYKVTRLYYNYNIDFYICDNDFTHFEHFLIYDCNLKSYNIGENVEISEPEKCYIHRYKHFLSINENIKIYKDIEKST